MQHRPASVVRTNFQCPLQTLGGDVLLVRGEHPAHGEPHRQRCARLVEDRAGGHRTVSPAVGAFNPVVSQPPAAGVAALGADETGGPAERLEEVQTIRIGGKPRLELTHRSGVVLACARAIHEPNSTPSNCMPPDRGNASQSPKLPELIHSGRTELA